MHTIHNWIKSNLVNLIIFINLNQARFYQASAHRAITMIKKGAHHKCHSSYAVQHTAFLTSHCFHLWHKVYSYCTFKSYFLLFTKSINVYFIILVLEKSGKVHTKPVLSKVRFKRIHDRKLDVYYVLPKFLRIAYF